MTASDELWPEVRPEAARRLMLAGVRAFAERGFHATTTRDIAAGAGMSPAGLYVYFPSKRALLHAISRSGHEQMLTRLTAIAAAGEPPPVTLGALVEAFVSWHARRHVVARVVQYELHALDGAEYREIAQLRRRIERLVRGTIAAGVADGAFRVADERTAARAVLSLGIDVARWYDDTARTGPAALGRQYAELALRLVGAEVPAGRE